MAQQNFGDLEYSRVPWDRAIFQHDIQANYKADAGAQSNQHRLENPDWTMLLIKLRTPIPCRENFDVIELADIRIYPPFEIDRGLVATATYKDQPIPLADGSKIRCDAPLISHPTVSWEPDIRICYGLRVDIRKGVHPTPVVEKLLRWVRERTRQWWLSTANDPFDLGDRLLCLIDKDFRPLEQAVNEGGERLGSNPWIARVAFQRGLGFERCLDQAEWDQVRINLQNSHAEEMATSNFMDAVASYMSYSDTDAILKCCVAMEIMEIKSKLMDGITTDKYGDALLIRASLWRQEDRLLIKKMFSDRGHIAHGKRPYHFRAENGILVQYLELCFQYYGKFVERVGERGKHWNEISR